MLSQYIDKKLNTATYKILDDKSYFGEIPSVKGVWANAKTLEKCRAELQEVLEEWLFLKVRENSKIEGLSFSISKKNTLHHA